MELKGDYFWHQHDHEEEAFYVISGGLQVELENGVVDLKEGQNCTIPAGTLHRPKANERVVVLVVEGRSDILKNS
jgi:mannose-6-phosphate isomerase-like protein (cupin superfamily)